MAEYILQTKDLGISFGGLKAAQNVNISIKKNQIYGLIGPNGAGKTTIFNLLTCVYKPTAGTFFLDGEEIKWMSPDRINHKGIARTFQNIRLFGNMTVLENVMVGRHCRTHAGIWGALMRDKASRREEQDSIDRSYALLEF